MAAKGGPDLDCGDRGWGDVEAGTTLNVTQPTSSVPDYCQRDDAATSPSFGLNGRLAGRVAAAVWL
jgi:hypothetical protein